MLYSHLQMTEQEAVLRLRETTLQTSRPLTPSKAKRCKWQIICSAASLHSRVPRHRPCFEAARPNLHAFPRASALAPLSRSKARLLRFPMANYPRIALCAQAGRRAYSPFFSGGLYAAIFSFKTGDVHMNDVCQSPFTLLSFPAAMYLSFFIDTSSSLSAKLGVSFHRCHFLPLQSLHNDLKITSLFYPMDLL